MDAITPNAIYKKTLESKVVLKVNVRLNCLFESNNSKIKLKRKTKTLNEIRFAKSVVGIGIKIKKNVITPKMTLNENMNGSDSDLFSGLDVDKDSI
jgi:hypothetical protein